MSVNLSSLAGAAAQFFDNNGVPLAGGLIYTYLAGTNTPAATYTSSTGLIAHSNPIVLDAAGRIATGEVWLTTGVDYKFLVKTSVGVQLGSYDNIPSINDFTSIYADLANTTNPALGDALIGFRQSNSSGNLSGAVGRTVHQKLQESISVKDFGAVGDGVTDDTAAIQAAINALTAGGVVNFPLGIYRTTATISISVRGITLQGQIQTTTNADEGNCRILVDHDLGAGVRIFAYNTTLDTLIITGSASRVAAGFTGTNSQPNFGVWIEAADVSGGAGYIQRIKLRDVTVRNQPNSGVVSVGENAGSEFYSVASLYNGGHAFVFSNGYYTNRVNQGAPGIVEFINCRATDCGGHALAIGSPFDTSLSSYRFMIENLECFRICTDATILYDTSAIFMAGQNNIINLSAAGDVLYSFATVSGRNIQINNCRMFGASPAVKVVERAGGAEPTRGVYVVAPGLFPNAGTKYDPVVEVDPVCQEVYVDIANDQRTSQTTYIRAMNTDFQGFYKKDPNGINIGFPVTSESISSTETITILNDSVYEYEFQSTTSHGILVLHGFSDSTVYAMCVFRAASSVFMQQMIVGSDVNTTTGALTGTTGVVGKFTISVDATKLYFENRRGGTRFTKITFLSGDFVKKYV
jgi:hypothetical protein